MNLKRAIFYILIAVTAFSVLAAGCGKRAEEAAAPKVKGEVTKEAPPAMPQVPKKEKTLYSFEGDTQYWVIPEWALEKEDLVAKSIEVSKDYVSAGYSSLKVTCDFPGKIWTAALVELEEYLDWSTYKSVSCDMYLPKDAPEGLKAKIILTVGDAWKFTEMATAIFLIPGRWTTVSANLEPGTGDWKMTVVDDAFRTDVRKVALRIESNKGPIYSGAVYIDNIRVEES